MHIAATILSILLALVGLGAGVPKVLLKGTSAELQSHMGLSTGLIRFIGLAEVAAAAGLVIGLFWPPLGIATTPTPRRAFKRWLPSWCSWWPLRPR